jgi:hypothetical protein
VPQPISGVGGDGFATCLFQQPDGVPLKVDIYANDPDKKYFSTLSGTNDQQLPGVGDEAYWNQPVQGRTPPELSARKGSVTCVIQSNDPPDTTLKITTTNAAAGLYTVTDADALAYVKLMGKVCGDVFSGT